jgi:23S rRNA pseudouridine955/2504/2580 synthase|tara:strand:- start:1023 stop:2027 length:1005 start_codon:yes stop_codon:yes gene_type:complete
MDKVRLVSIGPESDGQRIDNFLITQLKGVPKSRIYRLIRKGEVRLNSGRIKPDRRLQNGDQVRIPPVRTGRPLQRSAPTDRQSILLEERILFEDERLLVINKPAGMAVHGGSGVNHGVIEALRHLRPTADYLELVHRLDRDTSGCLLIAKKRSALRRLHEYLRTNSMHKIYVALLVGRFPRRRQQLSAPLLKNELRSGERMSQVHADGKEAKTLFKVIRYYRDTTLVEARPVTGRTHQIRVHCQHLGFPIVGDRKYGDADYNRGMGAKGLRRMLLHASEIHLPDGSPNGFPNGSPNGFPNGSPNGSPDGTGVIKAPLDEDFRELTDRLNANKNI